MVLIVFERLHQEQAEPRQVKGSREGTRGVLGPGSTQGAQAELGPETGLELRLQYCAEGFMQEAGDPQCQAGTHEELLGL